MDELARMNEEEDDKGGARNAIILAIVVILVGAYCLMFGLQTLVWIRSEAMVHSQFVGGNCAAAIAVNIGQSFNGHAGNDRSCTKGRPRESERQLGTRASEVFQLRIQGPVGRAAEASPIPGGRSASV